MKFTITLLAIAALSLGSSCLSSWANDGGNGEGPGIVLPHALTIGFADGGNGEGPGIINRDEGNGEGPG